MLFNSLNFAIFFVIVLAAYWCLRHKWQNHFLLFASYFFYGCWDWRFLSLIIISTLVDYTAGIKIENTNDVAWRKRWLVLSICTNLGILGFFKYFNFFAENLISLLDIFGIHLSPQHINIVLPVGISFYTFQTMSYTIDIYRGQLKPTRRFFDFALFVAFFPQLVAGPIERARNLLPQVLKPRTFSLHQFYEGSFLIFWGLYKKIFIADNLAKIVDLVFQIGGGGDGVIVLCGAYAFAFQIYCDFSGYSDIARGLAKLMGFDIMINFRLPYFAQNPVDFWRRWHISLSTWLRDYLYIPLGGNRKGNFILYRNLILTMLLGGLWHGAGWTFIIWGFYHGLILAIYRAIQPYLGNIFSNQDRAQKRLWAGMRIFITFNLVCIGWIIFRAHDLGNLVKMISALLMNFRIINVDPWAYSIFNEVLFYGIILFIVQFFQHKKSDLAVVLKWPALSRAFLYFVILVSMLIFGDTGEKSFIYFQF